jgi:Domain of unknown function (DUF4129)
MSATCVRRAIGILLLLSGGAAAGERDATVRSITISQYIARLDVFISTTAEADDSDPARTVRLMSDMPSAYLVNDSTHAFDISLVSLRRELSDWATNHDRSARHRLLVHLRTLRSGAAAYEQPMPDRSQERMLLRTILSRPEFRDIHGPTWFDALRQRVLKIVARWLGGSLAHSIIPTIDTAIVFAFLAIAVIIGIRLAHHLVKRGATVDTTIPPRLTSRSAEWPCLLTGAHAAAERGAWRDATHLTYWCAVSFLEARGTWGHDRARTPREYLRLLASSTDRDTLAALTQRCELVWYGTVNADAEAFAASIEDLKSIGCFVA